VEAIDGPDRDCLTRVVLDRVGDKWSVLVVLTLGDGSRRFTELRDRMVGVTAKVLTQTLRGMERDGLLTRTVYAEVPPRVEYELTALGRSLRGPVEAIKDWADKHVTELMSAREAHDAAHAHDKAASW
jgi:DNA-binding HxlR family transcriptional regulator